jgi:cyclopropane fatty-acyl-phospholipid synthase-like methyltransferase
MVWFNPVRRMFDSCYRQGTPVWEIGRPRQQFVDLFARGKITGDVIDIGCGSGDIALFLAGQGLPVWGIDFSPEAIRRAEEKARDRGIRATFRVQNALVLEDLGRTFDTATDSGFFHNLDRRERPAFAKSLGAILRPGGKYFLLCFSNENPPAPGPRHLSQEEIRESFRDGWIVDPVNPTVFECNDPALRRRGWLAEIARKG